MLKSRRYAAQKIAEMPGIMGLSDAEMEKLRQAVKLEPEDIMDLLQGHNIGLIDDFSDIAECSTEALFGGLKLFAESGFNPELEAWQRNSGLDFTINPAAEMLSGEKMDFRKIRTMKEETLKDWIVTYLEAIKEQKHYLRRE